MTSFSFTDANGTRRGPHVLAELRALAAQEILTPRTLMAADSGQNGVAWQISGLFRFSYTDADGQKQAINDQELRSLASQGIIESATPLTTDTGIQVRAGGLSGLVFHYVEVAPPDITNKLILWLVLFGISCFLTLVGFFTWTFLMLVAFVAAIIFLILAYGEPKRGEEARKMWEREQEHEQDRRIQECAEFGATQAQYDWAGRCEKAGRLDEALRWYGEAAKLWYADAQRKKEHVEEKIQKAKDDAEKRRLAAIAEQKRKERMIAERHKHTSCPDVFYAVRRGAIEDVKYFVEQEGVSVNARGTDGDALLFKAVSRLCYYKGNRREEREKNMEIFQYLISRGASVRVELVTCDFGATPLHIVAEYAGVDALQCLMDNGADVNARARGLLNQTPLHRAANGDNTEALRFLVSKGAQVNAKDADGCPPMQYTTPGSAAWRYLESIGAKNR